MYNITLVELKVTKFQNEFMKSSFLPKYEQCIAKISALTTKGRNPDNSENNWPLANDIRFKVKLWNAFKGQEISEWSCRIAPNMNEKN